MAGGEGHCYTLSWGAYQTTVPQGEVCLVEGGELCQRQHSATPDQSCLNVWKRTATNATSHADFENKREENDGSASRIAGSLSPFKVGPAHRGELAHQENMPSGKQCSIGRGMFSVPTTPWGSWRGTFPYRDSQFNLNPFRVLELEPEPDDPFRRCRNGYKTYPSPHVR